MTAPEFSVSDACRRAADGRRAARMVADWARQFELSEPEFQLLWCVHGAQEIGVDQRTLAGWLAFSPAQISATVERLQAAGWIVQHVCRDDRRRHLVQLAEAGAAKLAVILSDAGQSSQADDEREAAA